MSSIEPSGRRRIILEVVASLHPFLEQLGFGRRGKSFHRLVDAVWQSVSVFYNKGWINIQLDAASLSARRALGQYADALLGSSANEQTPPQGGDVEPLCVGSWDWRTAASASLDDMQRQLASKVASYFGELSSEDALLTRASPGLVRAVLYALRGDSKGVARECANVRRSCIDRAITEPRLKELARAVGVGIIDDWRLQVRLVYETLEHADPQYKMDPEVLTDEYYEKMAHTAAATANGLSPRERNELIRETLQYDDDPGLTMIINGITYSREELVTLLDVAREDPSESPGA